MTSVARLGNITGALLLRHWEESGDRRQADSHAASSLNALFEENLLVGGEPSADWPGRRVNDPKAAAGELYSLLAAFEAATSERVLVPEPAAGICADLLLAMTAWPESDAVIVSEFEGGPVLCSVFRREACAETAREMLEAGDVTRSAFLNTLASEGDTQEISVERLGLSDWRKDGCKGRRWAGGVTDA